LEKITQDDFAALLEQDSNVHYKNRKTREFLIELADSLPGRDVLSVMRHLIKLYPVEKYDNEPWTKEDDLKLAGLVAQKGKIWTKLAAEMGRSAEIVRLRYKDYVSMGENRVSGRWSESEVDRLNEAIVERLIEVGREGEGLNRKEREQVSGFVDWNAVSLRVETRSRLQCRSRYIKCGLRTDKEENGD
jgi:Myb-like DNA-binding protein REB1